MQHIGGRWRWRRCPLRRRWDVLDAWLGLLTALALLLGVPAVGLSAGLATYGAQRVERAEQLAERRTLTGRLLEPVPADPSATGFTAGIDRIPAKVRWTGPDGQRHTGTIDVETGTRKGAAVTVWTYRDGRLADPPMTTAQAADDGVAAGLGTGMALVLALLAVRWGGRRYLDRVRLAEWEREWARIGPRWGRSPI
ncbi:Rv1733c family protein [Streptomyces sp. CA-132043]|uniref:Rv1733c family protein n=1 Tax=Streptomyces sp. CA-132043 TaxID=3240048 RepID=UPI003D8D55DF